MHSFKPPELYFCALLSESTTAGYSAPADRASSFSLLSGSQRAILPPPTALLLFLFFPVRSGLFCPRRPRFFFFSSFRFAAGYSAPADRASSFFLLSGPQRAILPPPTALLLFLFFPVRSGLFCPRRPRFFFFSSFRFAAGYSAPADRASSFSLLSGSQRAILPPPTALLLSFFFPVRSGLFCPRRPRFFFFSSFRFAAGYSAPADRASSFSLLSGSQRAILPPPTALLLFLFFPVRSGLFCPRRPRFFFLSSFRSAAGYSAPADRASSFSLLSGSQRAILPPPTALLLFLFFPVRSGLFCPRRPRFFFFSSFRFAAGYSAPADRASSFFLLSGPQRAILPPPTALLLFSSFRFAAGYSAPADRASSFLFLPVRSGLFCPRRPRFFFSLPSGSQRAILPPPTALLLSFFFPVRSGLFCPRRPRFFFLSSFRSAAGYSAPADRASSFFLLSGPQRAILPPPTALLLSFFFPVRSGLFCPRRPRFFFLSSFRSAAGYSAPAGRSSSFFLLSGPQRAILPPQAALLLSFFFPVRSGLFCPRRPLFFFLSSFRSAAGYSAPADRASSFFLLSGPQRAILPPQTALFLSFFFPVRSGLFCPRRPRFFFLSPFRSAAGYSAPADRASSFSLLSGPQRAIPLPQTALLLSLSFPVRSGLFCSRRPISFLSSSIFSVFSELSPYPVGSVRQPGRPSFPLIKYRQGKRDC
ncbi:hypothetical protein LSTR_LSTR002856 [Laodelphax striatellus]|uniref:Uncharacterized protein n=1 Tax=Laodelphax striatellus TaxID=195883 RepID=A0A482XHX1_LAOST|nr:hypothetical protein LSTR_LSTR002856 [Laodelphax striatellus]